MVVVELINWERVCGCLGVEILGGIFHQGYCFSKSELVGLFINFVRKSSEIREFGLWSLMINVKPLNVLLYLILYS